MHNDLQLSGSVLSTTGEFDSIETEWKELYGRTECNSVFMTFEWLSQWWKHFGQQRGLAIVIVRNHGSLVALAPLCISRQGVLRFRRLGFLGDTLVGSDYLNFLVVDSYKAEALRCVCNCIIGIRDQWDYIELADFLANSDVLQTFHDVAKGSGMAINPKPSTICPYVALPGTVDQYWASLRSRLRKNLRYHMRLLQRQAKVAFVKVDAASEIEQAFDDVTQLHEARFRARHRSSTFLAPEVKTFHRTAAKSLAAAGLARIYFLELDGKRIAGMYGFSNGRTFSLYQSGSDPAYGRFSVGTLLISSVMQALIEEGHSEFDFLRGQEAYKQLWATGERELRTVSFFDKRGASRAAYAAQILRGCLRECKAAILNCRKSRSDNQSLRLGSSENSATPAAL